MIDFNKKPNSTRKTVNSEETFKGVTAQNLTFLKQIGFKVKNNGRNIRIKHKRIF